MRSDVIIRRPLHTEKSVAAIQNNNQYHFEVDRRANKHEIRRAVEAMFPGVRVSSVNTERVKGKARRLGRMSGHTKDWKKAIVKLRSGDNIDIGY